MPGSCQCYVGAAIACSLVMIDASCLQRKPLPSPWFLGFFLCLHPPVSFQGELQGRAAWSQDSGQAPRLVRVAESRTERPARVHSLVVGICSTLPKVRLMTRGGMGAGLRVSGWGGGQCFIWGVRIGSSKFLATASHVVGSSASRGAVRGLAYWLKEEGCSCRCVCDHSVAQQHK